MRTRVRLALAALLAVSLGMHAWDLAVPGLLDRSGRLKGADFLQFYTYGSLASAGEAGALYEPAAHARVARQRVSPALAFSDFHPNYPPVIAALMAPLTRLPFLDALALWTVISIALYAAAVALLARLAGRVAADRLTLVLAAAAWPALFMTLRYGQISALALLLLAGAAYADVRRQQPLLAGLLLGSLVYKPTLVVIPLAALVLARQWRIVLGAAAAVAAQTGAGVAISGRAAFSEYVGVLWQLAASPDVVQLHPAESHSLRGFVRLISPAPGVTTAVAVIGALAGIAALAYVWRRERDGRLRWGALTVFTLAASPHLLTYDLLLLAVPLVLVGDWLLENARTTRREPWKSALILLYAGAWPGVLLARIYHVQISTIGMVMAGWLLVRQAARAAD